MKYRRHPSYWQKNLIWIGTLLLLWSVFALGGGVLWVSSLNKFQIGELPLGFWFAQQGAVISFVCLVFVYAIVMARLDAQHIRRTSKTPSDSD
ncbi:MAG: DUF4212 domain-containing protein [Cyanobacteria bacterium J06632_3]